MPRLLPLALLLLATPAVAAPVPKETLTKEQEAEFNDLWDRAYRSDSARGQLYCRFVSERDAAVEYLTRTMKPAKLDVKEAKALIADLNSKEEAVWKRAYRELRMRDVRLAMTFDDAWALAKTDEQKLRLGLLASGFGAVGGDIKKVELNPPTAAVHPGKLYLTESNPYHANGSAPVFQTFEQWVAGEKARRHDTDPRIVLGVAALERIGSKSARSHLRDLANEGHSKAWTTNEALAGLDRMNAPKPDVVPFSELWAKGYDVFSNAPHVNQFLDRPEPAVKFIKENLRPSKLTADEAKRLLARLFSDDSKEARVAHRVLDQLDVRLAMTMEDAWKEAKTPSDRGRLVSVMTAWGTGPNRVISDDSDLDERHRWYDYELLYDKRFDEWVANGVWRPEVPEQVRRQRPSPAGGGSYGNTADRIDPRRWYRENTSIAILDAIGTDDAIGIIKEMATGHPDAGPTKAAKDVLKRRGMK